MTDAEQPFLSRRQRREAERSLTGDSEQYVAEQSLVDAPLADLAAVASPTPSVESHGGIPSRKDLRRLARETGVIPMLTAEMLDQAEKGMLDIEEEIRHHTGAVPTLPADVVVGVDDTYIEPTPTAWPTGSVTPISSTENLDVAMPQWPSGSVPAIDDEVKKMEQRALTGDLTGVAEALAAQEAAAAPAGGDPIAAAWAVADSTVSTPRTVSFDDIIAPAPSPTEAPVAPMNVDVDLPVSDAPVAVPYVEVEQANTSAPIAPLPAEPVAAVVVPEVPVAVEQPAVVEPEQPAVVEPEQPAVVEPEPVAAAPAVVIEEVVIPEPVVVEAEPEPELEPVTEAEPEPELENEPESVVEIPAASPEIPPARDGDWRDQMEADNENEWVKNHETGIGVMQSPTLQTLVVDSFHTGDITGPLNPTGEILITGQIILDQMLDDEPATEAIDAGVDVNQPGIPRRASEALSIIGKPAEAEERKRIPSVGSAAAAGLAAFLGLAVVVLGLLAYFTDII